jgi:hypothetical protein
MPDLTVTGAVRSGAQAYAMAGLRPVDIDVVQVYDAFTLTTLLFLEDLGFCAKGEGGAFVADGAIAPGGRLPVNTSGGGLSYWPSGHVRPLRAHRGCAPAARRVRRAAGGPLRDRHRARQRRRAVQPEHRDPRRSRHRLSQARTSCRPPPPPTTTTNQHHQPPATDHPPRPETIHDDFVPKPK